MTSDDLLGTVKAALDSFKRCRCWLPHCGACRAFVEMDKTNTIISLVARCEQAEADLAADRAEVTRQRERVRRAVEATCTCGGRGLGDGPGPCLACLVWHRAALEGR